MSFHRECIPHFYLVYSSTVRDAHRELVKLISSATRDTLVVIGVGGRNYSKLLDLELGEIILYKALDMYSYVKSLFKGALLFPQAIIVADGLDSLVGGLDDWKVVFLVAATLFKYAEAGGASILVFTGKDGKPSFAEYILRYWCQRPQGNDGKSV